MNNDNTTIIKNEMFNTFDHCAKYVIEMKKGENNKLFYIITSNVRVSLTLTLTLMYLFSLHKVKLTKWSFKICFNVKINRLCSIRLFAVLRGVSILYCVQYAQSTALYCTVCIALERDLDTKWHLSECSDSQKSYFACRRKLGGSMSGDLGHMMSGVGRMVSWSA